MQINCRALTNELGVGEFMIEVFVSRGSGKCDPSCVGISLPKGCCVKLRESSEFGKNFVSLLIFKHPPSFSGLSKGVRDNRKEYWESQGTILLEVDKKRLVKKKLKKRSK